MSNGLFVVIEGLDGVGKSAVINAVHRMLVQCNFEVTIASDAVSTVFIDDVQKQLSDPGQELDALTKLLLFNAARRRMVSTVILPAMARGEVVICERYMLSNLVEHHSEANSHEWLLTQHDEYVGLVPDMMFCLDAETQTLHKRHNLKAGTTPGVFDKAVRDEINRKRNDYKLALFKAKAWYEKAAPHKVANWGRLMNDLPSHVVESEIASQVLHHYHFSSVKDGGYAEFSAVS